MKISASSKVSNTDSQEDLKRFVSAFQEQVTTVLNGNISFPDNFFSKIIPFNFKAINQTLGMDHGLGVIPVGYFLVGSNTPLSLFDGNQKNTVTTIYLQSSAIGVAQVMVFG